jgi:cytochrome c-type biogenesis protein CcmH/NrfG
MMFHHSPKYQRRQEQEHHALLAATKTQILKPIANFHKRPPNNTHFLPPSISAPAYLKSFLATGLLLLCVFSHPVQAESPVTLEEMQALAALEISVTGTSSSPDTVAKLDRLYQELLARSPENPDLVAQYGRFQLAHREAGAALATLRRAAELAPDRSDLWMQLSTAALSTGDTRSATEATACAVRLSPKDSSLHYHYAHLLYLFRKDVAPHLFPTEADALREALRHFREATVLSPENPNLWLAYAETFWMMPEPDWKEARRAWTEYGKRTDKREFAHVQLARVAIEQGDLRSAKSYLHEVRDESFALVKKKLLARIAGMEAEKP